MMMFNPYFAHVNNGGLQILFDSINSRFYT